MDSGVMRALEVEWLARGMDARDRYPGMRPRRVQRTDMAIPDVTIYMAMNSATAMRRVAARGMVACLEWVPGDDPGILA